MKKLLGVAVLVALVIATILVAPNPFKVTDPTDPRFDPNNFRFSDYSNRDAYHRALPVIFPVGMPREQAEKWMLNAGATLGETLTGKNNRRVLYIYRPFMADLHCCQNFSILYDENNTVEQVQIGSGKVHSNQLTVREIRVNPQTINDRKIDNDKPTKFRFHDYHGDDQGIEEFRALFPVGTSKSVIDRTFVEMGGAKSSEIKGITDQWAIWRYDFNTAPNVPGGAAHIVIFDKSDRLENIYFYMTKDLYPNRITLSQIKNIAKDRRNK